MANQSIYNAFERLWQHTNVALDAHVEEAKQYTDEKIAAIPAQTDYSVSVREDTTDSSIAKRYIFSQCGSEIAKIDLAKELVVTSGSVETVTTENVPYDGAVVGDKYICLTIANQEEPIYVPAKDLVDIYHAETYEDGDTVEVEISDANVISAHVVPGSITEEHLHYELNQKIGNVW